MNDQEPAETPLEPHILMPRGRVAPRCQRVKRDGVQCSKPARSGCRTCPSHGAGYPSREASGERQRPGRPTTTGTYSTAPTRSFADAQAEVASLKDALTSPERDLIALKSVQVMKLAELEAHAPKVQAMETALEALAAEAKGMNFDRLTPEEAMWFVRRFAQLQKPAARLSKLVSEVADLSTKSVNAHNARAQAKSKLAEAEGVRVFLMLLSVIRPIVHSLAPDENYKATYELALQREVLGPNRLEVPPLDLEPDKR